MLCLLEDAAVATGATDEISLFHFPLGAIQQRP
jgi:hypothetical protein